MSDAAKQTTLAILAGGEGARMGKPKALLAIGEIPILKYILQQAQWPGSTLLVTAPGRQSPPGVEAFDFEAVDPSPGQGPVRGLLTALENAKTERVVVSAVDMPCVGAEVFQWLALRLIASPQAAGIMLQREGKIEPFPSAWRTSAAAFLRREMEQGRNSLRGLSAIESVTLVSDLPHWPVSVWTNLNFPDDMARAGFV